MGMTGSALSNLLPTVVVNLLLLALVKWKCGTSPFSWAQLKVVLVITALFLVNVIWKNSIYPLFISAFSNKLLGAIVDGVVKTGLFAIIVAVVVYFWRVSDEVNMLIRKILVFVKRKL